MSASYAAAFPPQSRAEASPHRWLAVGILFLATTMNLLDVTIVNVGLPAMQAGMRASSTQIEWVSAIYVLAFAGGLLPLGRLGDMLGQRLVFIGGVVVFTLASLFCGLAPNIDALIAGRLLQGIGGAAMVPQVLALVAKIFPPEERPMVFSLFGVVGSLASVLGPLLGGALISADIAGLGWRAIFLINLPVGIAVVLGALLRVPRPPANRALRLDPIGISLFALATFLAVFPLIEGRAFGWPWWLIALLAVCPLVGLAFYRWEERRYRLGLSELLPAGLLKNPQFLLGLMTITLFFSAIPGLFLVLAMVLQTGFGLTPLQSGWATMPFPAGVMIASLLSGRLGGKWLSLRVGGGAMLLASGMTYLQFALVTLDQQTPGTALAAPLLLCGLGMGVAISALFQSLMAGVDPRQSGAASGAMQAFQHVGGALGIAIAGHLFFSSLGNAQDAASFGQAASNATWYQIAVFIVLAVINLWAASRRPSSIHLQEIKP